MQVLPGWCEGLRSCCLHDCWAGQLSMGFVTRMKKNPIIMRASGLRLWSRHELLRHGGPGSWRLPLPALREERHFGLAVVCGLQPGLALNCQGQKHGPTQPSVRSLAAIIVTCSNSL